VCHRTVSGAPGGLRLQLVTLGKIQSRRAIIHRTVRCTPDSVRCSNGSRFRNSPASGIPEGCSAIIHRTCPVCTGLSGASTEQRLLRRQRLPALHLMRAQRAQKSESPILAHRTVNSTCPVRHRTSRRAQKSAQPTVKFGGWGYKYPNHPTIHSIQVFYFPTTTRALAFNSRHIKEIKSSPNSTQRPSD
jgi:hypothetical protein